MVGKGLDLLTALTTPRIHSQLIPFYTETEDTHEPYSLDIVAKQSTTDALLSRGHTVVAHNGEANAQFIVVDPITSELVGVSDPRKDGRPAGI